MSMHSKQGFGPPSDPISLEELSDAFRDLPVAPASHAVPLDERSLSAVRDRCSLAPLRLNAADLASDAHFMTALRERWAAWARWEHLPSAHIRKRKWDRSGTRRTSATGADSDQDGEVDAAEQDAEEDPFAADRITSERLSRMDQDLPPAFRFPPAVRVYTRRKITRQENALLAPVPSRLLTCPSEGQGRRPRQVQEAFSIAGPSSLSASESHTLDTSATMSPRFILSISVYSPRPVPLTRKSRKRVKSGAAEDPGSEQVEGETPSDGEDRHGASSKSAVSRERHDLLHTHSVQLLSDQTLADLRAAIPCHSDGLPERIGWEKRLQKRISHAHKRARNDTETLSAADAGVAARSEEQDERDSDSDDELPRYAVRKRQTGCCMIFEDRVYSDGRREGEGEELTDYASLILRSASSSKSPQMRNLSDPKLTMTQARFDKMPSIRIGQPYWFFHQGDCEHLFVVDSIRLSHPDDPPARSSYPLTTYICSGAQTRSWTNLESLGANNNTGSAPASVVGTSNNTGHGTSTNTEEDTNAHTGAILGYGPGRRLERCTFCENRPAKMIIFGGERVRPMDWTRAHEQEDAARREEEERREEKGGLRGLRAMKEPCCLTCWDAMVGSRTVGDGTTANEADGDGGVAGAQTEAESALQAPTLTSTSTSTNADPKGKQKQLGAGTAEAVAGTDVTVAGPNTRTEPGTEPRTGQVTYAGAGGKGWTVVPLL